MDLATRDTKGQFSVAFDAQAGLPGAILAAARFRFLRVLRELRGETRFPLDCDNEKELK
jgi:hypothetical protein